MPDKQLWQTRPITGAMDLQFLPDDQETADRIEFACNRSLPIILSTLGLHPPKRCRVVVMTSPLRFIFQSAPWHLRILFALNLPIWYPRMKKTWALVAGLTLRYRRRPAVGIKPPRLLAACDTSVGEKIYYKEPDCLRKVEYTTCHELTHALSAHLRLPMWINEGIAMVTVDRYCEHPSVKSETLCMLNDPRYRRTAGSYRNLTALNKEVISYQYARSYWLTRFLMEKEHALMMELLEKRLTGRRIIKRIADATGLCPNEFWEKIDGKIFALYGSELHPRMEHPGENQSA